MTNSFNMSDWRRKYVLMAENDLEHTPEKTNESTSDSSGAPYDSNKHKTYEKTEGYHLEGNDVVGHLVFTEEPDEPVLYRVPKRVLEKALGVDIYDEEDLQAIDSTKIYNYFDDLFDTYSGIGGKLNKMKQQSVDEEVDEVSGDMLSLYERYLKNK